ncbi:DNA polymerase III subunit epsilon [Neisseria yangbaofengii]|uniref:DNA polymerase III subunit epsilon n=1 Tax=Neisseria yangbaofengii TaxID=2709396 RepID=UPI0013EC56C2|nr:DNA polymerase III subunit epsilon [Neisseria yangbaofengii]
MSKRQIIFDTETTGFLDDPTNRMIEFAGVEMVNRQLTGNYLHLYIHPERDIPEDAVKVHGLTLEVLEEKNAPVFAAVGNRIADFICDAEIIAHNAPFDEGFLNREFSKIGLPTVRELGCQVTDTLAMAREMFPGQKNSLDVLCNRFSVDRSKRVLHGALIDCELLADVYLAMTRQQFDLMGANEESGDRQTSANPVQTTRNGRLKVVCADENELAGHEQYLDALGDECVWRKPAAERQA